MEKNKNDKGAKSLLASITEGETAAKLTAQAQNAQLWTACTEAASQAQDRFTFFGNQAAVAQCGLAAGDIEGVVGDLTYVVFYQRLHGRT